MVMNLGGDKYLGGITDEELDKKNVPMYLRDKCVRHTIKLNDCRHDCMYAPWKCEEERLRLERCLYKQYMVQLKLSDMLWKKEQEMKLTYEKMRKSGALSNKNGNSSTEETSADE